MKIIAINGSHRGKHGLTQILIEQFFVGAKRAGAQCETVVLSKKKIIPCKGCRVCQTENSYLHCIYEKKDDTIAIIKKIEQADIIIYATPIYVFSMSGIMKIFIERIMASTSDSTIRTISKSGLIFHHVNKKIASKRVILITCQDNAENRSYNNVVDYFKMFSAFLDAPVIAKFHRKSGELFLTESKKLYSDKIRSVYKAYAKAGEELVIYNKISKATINKANQNIIPIPKLIEVMLNIPIFRKSNFIMQKILFNIVKLSNKSLTVHSYTVNAKYAHDGKGVDKNVLQFSKASQ